MANFGETILAKERDYKVSMNFNILVIMNEDTNDFFYKSGWKESCPMLIIIIIIVLCIIRKFVTNIVTKIIE